MQTTSPAKDRSAAEAAASARARFEPIALLLLSLATLGTAWCSFQAAVWGGLSQRVTNLSAAASRRAVVAQLQSYQFTLADVLLFSQHINARANSNEALARFYSYRLRGEARQAFDSWMMTRPFENTNAPAHPFVTNLYQPRLLQDAREAEAESGRLWLQGGEAGRTSRSYILITVVLACALFCGGTASKFDTVWVRRSVLVVGLLAFAFAGWRLLMLPVQL